MNNWDTVTRAQATFFQALNDASYAANLQINTLKNQLLGLGTTVFEASKNVTSVSIFPILKDMIPIIRLVAEGFTKMANAGGLFSSTLKFVVGGLSIVAFTKLAKIFCVKQKIALEKLERQMNL